MLPKSLSIGPFVFHFYGLIIAIAVFAGWLVAKRRAYLYNQRLRSSTPSAGLKIPDKVLDDPILILPLLLGIFGGRLYHVLDRWDLYRTDLVSIIYIDRGGLGIWGALLGIFLGFLIVAKVKKLKLAAILDLAAPSVLLGQAIGRVGNYVNQEGFGPPTTRPWGVFINESNRPPVFINYSHFHPTFFYEAAIDLIFFALLLFLSKRLKLPGQVFALYLILYSMGRYVVEFWRIDTWIVEGVKVAQVFSIATLIGGLVILFWGQLKKKISAN